MSEPRSVLVTGANRGIGRAIAERFVAAGDKVATIYRTGDLPAGVLGVVGDVRDTASIDAAFTQIEAAHGPVEVLVANAGVTRDQLVLRMTDEEFEQVLDVNVTGSFRCVRRATSSAAGSATDVIRGTSGVPERALITGRVYVVGPVRAGWNGDRSAPALWEPDNDAPGSYPRLRSPPRLRVRYRQSPRPPGERPSRQIGPVKAMGPVSNRK